MIFTLLVLVLALAAAVAWLNFSATGVNKTSSIRVDECLKHSATSDWKDLIASGVVTVVHKAEAADYSPYLRVQEFLYVGGGTDQNDKLMGYDESSATMVCVLEVPKSHGDSSSTNCCVVVQVNPPNPTQQQQDEQQFVVLSGRDSGNLYATPLVVSPTAANNAPRLARSDPTQYPSVKLYENSLTEFNLTQATGSLTGDVVDSEMDYNGRITSLAVGRLSANREVYGIYAARFVMMDKFKPFQYGATGEGSNAAGGGYLEQLTNLLPSTESLDSLLSGDISGMMLDTLWTQLEPTIRQQVREQIQIQVDLMPEQQRQALLDNPELLDAAITPMSDAIVPQIISNLPEQVPEDTKVQLAELITGVVEEEFLAALTGEEPVAIGGGGDGDGEVLPEGAQPEGSGTGVVSENLLFVVEDWLGLMARIADEGIEDKVESYLASPDRPQHSARRYDIDGKVTLAGGTSSLTWNSWTAAFVRLDASKAANPPSIVIANDEGPFIIKHNNGFGRFFDLKYLDNKDLQYPEEYPTGFWMGLAVDYPDEYVDSNTPSIFSSNIGEHKMLNLALRLGGFAPEIPENITRNHLLLRPKKVSSTTTIATNFPQFLDVYDSKTKFENSDVVLLPGPSGFGWGCQFADLTLNGHPDLLMATGFRQQWWEEKLPMLKSKGVVWIDDRMDSTHTNSTRLKYRQTDELPNPFFGNNPLLASFKEVSEQTTETAGQHPQQLVWINEDSLPVTYSIPTSLLQSSSEEWIGIYISPTAANANTVVRLQSSSVASGKGALRPRYQTRQYIMGGTGLGACTSSVLMFGGLLGMTVDAVTVYPNHYFEPIVGLDGVLLLKPNRIYSMEMLPQYFAKTSIVTD